MLSDRNFIPSTMHNVPVHFLSLLKTMTVPNDLSLYMGKV